MKLRKYFNMSYLNSEINIKKLGFFLLLINSIHAISWFFHFRDGNEIFYLRFISTALAIAFLMPIKPLSTIEPYLLSILFRYFSFPFCYTSCNYKSIFYRVYFF